MAPGALWEGLDAFATGAKDAPPSTDMVAYPPLQATNGAKVTGDLGGGLWLVSKHSPDPKAAAALAQYMATSPKIQTPAVDAGLPQYVPDEASYLSSLNNVFGDASETEATWKAAAAEVWDGWSPVPWSTDNVWASTNLAAVTASPPASLAAQLVPYAEALANQARLAGYTVKSPNSTVATGS
jgi:ABC-type glycerol-3-phosphate transport system substrate-binding protein